MPEIGFRYFDEGTTFDGAHEKDLEAMVEGVEFARTLGKNANTALSLTSGFSEIFPAADASDKEGIRSFVEREAWGHHASCTCPIGRDDDPMAVLDGNFRVRGTRGLRVVDASIFPKIPGFFIVSSIYMASEKASDVILADV